MPVHIPILFYHRILPDSEMSGPMPLTAPLSLFQDQMNWLKRRGYSTLTPAEFFEALQSGRCPKAKVCMITFDDGTDDHLRHALPVCLEHGFRPLVFAIAGMLGQQYSAHFPARLMSATDLREWIKQGGYVGCHSMSHPDLSKCPEKELHREILESKSLLEQETGEEIQTFCYPSGKYSDATLRLVEKAGYQCAFTTLKGNVHTFKDRFVLRRVKVGRGTSPTRLAYRTSRLYHWIHGRQVER